MPCIDNDKSFQIKLFDIRDNNAIIKEVKFTTSLIKPRFDFKHLDQAVSDEVAHRRNMNQSSGYSQRNYWRKLVDEKLKEIEEKKKQIEELEGSR